mmetsp:Transcript_30936/g.37981  ORF Transcript_30936/g.37981 Transcript_30936/m.37981 type:complete len:244 (-) Transcript_30936:2-733(-)
MAPLLMDVAEQMHLRLGSVDGAQQFLAGAPVSTPRHVKNAKGSIMGDQNVNTCRNVAVVVARPGVPAARMPAGAPDFQAHDLGHLVIQHFGIGDFALKIIGFSCFGFGQPAPIQAPVGVPIVVVASDDKHVLVLVLNGTQPVIEIAQFAVTSNFCYITRVDEDVGIGQVASGTMKAVGVADVEDGHRHCHATHLQTLVQHRGISGVGGVLPHGHCQKKTQDPESHGTDLVTAVNYETVWSTTP